jgi:hypothetical protein
MPRTLARYRWPPSSGRAPRQGGYSAKSTSKKLTHEDTMFALYVAIWKNGATQEQAFYVVGILTSDRRVRHGLQAHVLACDVCSQEENTADHILMPCVAAREVWYMRYRYICI